MGMHTAVVCAPGPPELMVKHKTRMKIIQTGEEDDKNLVTNWYIKTTTDKNQLNQDLVTQGSGNIIHETVWP